MANEAVFKYGTSKTLQTTGASVSASQLSAASSAGFTQTDTLDYPDAVFTLDVGTFGVAPVAGTIISLYVTPQDVDGTTDSPAPATGASTDAYRGRWVCDFVMKAATTGIYAAVGYDLPRAGLCNIYNGTGQATGTWTLKMLPRTLGPA